MDGDGRAKFVPAGGGALAVSPMPALLPEGTVPLPARLGRISWREARFFCIIAAVVLMSLADLTLTLTYATSVGMAEENPIARLLMRHGGVWSLTLWKAGTAGVGVFILWRVRHSTAAEIGAWVCFAALAALCFHWIRYNTQVSALTGEIVSLQQTKGTGEWIVMHPGDTP
jgi:hypothetical protein